MLPIEHKVISATKGMKEQDTKSVCISLQPFSQYILIKFVLVEDDFQEGIPQLAYLLDSNDSFCLHRRFGSITSRILILKEMELDQLYKKMKKLDDMDAREATSTNTKQRLRSLSPYGNVRNWNNEQKDLLSESETKVNSYCMLSIQLETT